MTELHPDVVTSLFGSIAASPDRVLLIGPVLPYRVGIAQHTTMLHRALRAQADCLTISFSRQYPRLLFPGKSDKDENLAGYIEGGVEYLIDSVNPLSWANAVSEHASLARAWWSFHGGMCIGCHVLHGCRTS